MFMTGGAGQPLFEAHPLAVISYLWKANVIIIFMSFSPLKWHIIHYNTPNIGWDMNKFVTHACFESLSAIPYCWSGVVFLNDELQCPASVSLGCHDVSWALVWWPDDEAIMMVILVAWSGLNWWILMKLLWCSLWNTHHVLSWNYEHWGAPNPVIWLVHISHVSA